MSSLRFGPFELDTFSGELKGDGATVKLRHQPSKVLALLASSPGRVFTREEIQAAVWGPGTHVDFEQGLNYCVKEIRAALGDRAESPTYVETLARRGYRFIAPVEQHSPVSRTHDVSLTPPPESPRRPRRTWPRWALAATVLAALAATLAIGVMRAIGVTRAGGPASSRVAIAVLPFANLSGDTGHDPFCAGLTEETQVQLGRLHPAGLAVIARTTSGGYSLRPHPIAALAHDLGVDYVLEGSVRHCAKHDRMRVTARLVRASNRRQIWSETLHEPLDDAVDMQQTIARTLAVRAVEALQEREPRLTALGPAAAGSTVATAAAAETPSALRPDSASPPR